MPSSFIDWLRHNKLEIVATSATAVLSILLVVGLVFLIDSPTDPSFERTIERIPSISSHHEYVETQVEISDRILTIEGVYLSDRQNGAYAGYSTTTITLPDLPLDRRTHTFTHANISVGPDVYTRIQTSSSFLKESIPHSDTWQHFKRSEIPRAFADIAVPGPIIENLRFLDQRGAYLRLIKSGSDALEGREYHTFTFELTGKEAEGNLQTVMDRIGDGTVELWADKDTDLPHRMVFRGPGYWATTTFSFVNNGPITPPQGELPVLD